MDSPHNNGKKQRIPEARDVSENGSTFCATEDGSRYVFDMTQLTNSEHELFVRLFGNHEQRIYSYILSLVPNWADADEIFQETNIRLWRDFQRFDRKTNFGAWAISIAYFQVLTWRKRRARNRLVFDEETVNLIAERHEQLAPMVEARSHALRDCFAELSDRNRDLLTKCYAPGVRVQEVSRSIGKTSSAVYKALRRIRASLRRCIERRIGRD